MNAGQQHAHTTRIAQVEAAILKLSTYTAERCEAIETRAADELATTRKLAQADFLHHTRAMTDTRIELQAVRDVAEHADQITGLRFFGRLRWLLTGRLR